jgi:hypothetical protein
MTGNLICVCIYMRFLFLLRCLCESNRTVTFIVQYCIVTVRHIFNEGRTLIFSTYRLF